MAAGYTSSYDANGSKPPTKPNPISIQYSPEREAHNAMNHVMKLRTPSVTPNFPTSRLNKKGFTTGALLIAVLSLLALPGRAAITVTNGSFEDTGTEYSAVLGGLYEATGWINLSALDIQASSALAGVEGTDSTFMTGSRFLRLASDAPTPDNQGAITQNLGTMTAGETYTFTADVFGGNPEGGQLWGATASFVSDGTFTPSTTYATQTVSGLGAGEETIPGFNFTYTATATDEGNALFVLLKAEPSIIGTGVRGGIDNVQVSSVTVPEAGTLMLVFPTVGVIGTVMIRRRKK